MKIVHNIFNKIASKIWIMNLVNILQTNQKPEKKIF